MFRKVRSRPVRFVVRAATAATLVSLAWFAGIRITAPTRAVNLVEPDTPRLVAPHTGPPRDTLRIAAFNLAHGRGLSEENYNDESFATRMNRLHAIGDLLGSHDLDAVVLNEVDFDSHWSGGVNQAAVIAGRMGFDFIVEQTSIDLGFPFWRLRFGNAVLSRHPIESAERVAFPAYVGWESVVAGHKRGLVCTIRPDHLPVYRLFAVHLEHRDEPTRIASARVIGRVARSPGPPLIAAGDFNSSPVGYPKTRPVDDETALGLLLDSDTFATHPEIDGSRAFFTYRADRPDRVIDWVLTPRDWPITTWTVIPTKLSDHCLVIAEVATPPSGE